jgi:tetratricopeptide (TPR) repeat protein
MGHLYNSEGDLEEALRYFAEAGKAAARSDPLVSAQAALSIAVIQGALGDNAGALRNFESLWPIIQSVSSAYPHLRGSHLNNLAVVLSATGRREEARVAIQAALSFPLAHRFPDWRETQREIEEAAKQKPRKRAPKGKVLAAARPERAAKKLPKPPGIFVVAIVGPVCISNLLSLRHSGPHVVSLLERYVKTVRIRDRP